MKKGSKMNLQGKPSGMLSNKTSCRMCGKCCHFEIPITLLDIHRMAKHLDVADKEVFDEYIEDRISSQSSLFMIRKNEEKACLFLTEEKKCAIHKAKPTACSFYVCTLNSDKEVLPWTATCTNPSERAILWEQSIAAMMTKAYIKENGATWKAADYYKAILGIYDNVVISERQRIKMARNSDGTPLAVIYDCSQCEKRGTCARETPITLDDIRHITNHLGITRKMFFRDKIASEPSVYTGGLKLKRDEQCIFFHPERHCTIKEVRPMHCRFTPCPNEIGSDEIMDCLFLGSGTVEEQFRHQVSLSMTRQYVHECGITYNKQVFKQMLRRIDHLAVDNSEFEDFCKKIVPYRYVDDTLHVLRHQEKEEG